MRTILTLFTILIITRADAGVQYAPADTNKLKFIEDIQFVPAPAGKLQSWSDVQPAAGATAAVGQAQAVSTPFSSNIEHLSPVQYKYGMLMNVDVESVTNEPLFRFIEEWYGAPYRMGGNTKEGTDCSSFASTLMQNIYHVNIARSSNQQFQQCNHIQKEQLKEGDLVFFNTLGGVSHVGVYLTNGSFVHASTSNGVIISNMSEPYYAERFVGAGRVK